MDPLSEDLFTQTSDGLILCKLINLAEFDTIDARSASTSSSSHIVGVSSPYIHPKERLCTSARVDSLLRNLHVRFLFSEFFYAFFFCMLGIV